jgi:hypothetical protein
MKNNNEYLAELIKDENLCELKKVCIIKKDNLLIRFSKVIPNRFYRNYYLKLVFKNGSSKLLLINHLIRDIIKYQITVYNSKLV